jgi:hypothetical protein
MRKIRLILIVLILNTGRTFSQDIIMSLEYKPATDSFYVYATPLFSDASFNMGASKVSIVYSNSFVINPTVATSFAITGVNGAWIAQDYAMEPLFAQKKYVGFTTPGAALGSVTGLQRILLFRYRVIGGNCLASTFSRNYANLLDPIDPDGTSKDFTTYLNVDGSNHNSINVDLSLLSCLDLLILPVKILEFNAAREGNVGVISWTATGEELNSNYYEIERSIDGSIFQPIAQIDCRRIAGVQKYEFSDQNITSLNSKYVYYRVRQYDFDNKFSVTGIRQLKMDISDKGVQMYPNPVKSGFYLNIPFRNPNQSKISLSIMNGTGQAIHQKEITTLQASNYYYDLNGTMLLPGNYYLKIVHEGQVVDIKKFLVRKE